MAGSPDVWGAFFKSVAMLGIVIALLVSLLYAVRRFSPMNRVKKGRKDIRVIAAHHLAPREKLVLVEVLGQKILLGVTPQTITSLASLGGEEDKTVVEGLDFPEVLNQTVSGSVGKGGDNDA